MSEKTKKIINIVVDVIIAIVLVLVLILAIGIISTRRKGQQYANLTEIFGTSYLAVESNSMEGDYEDSFNKGDLIKIRLVEGEAARNFEKGDIITFYTGEVNSDKQWQLNTHRIVDIKGEGSTLIYITRGDKATKDWGPYEGNENMPLTEKVSYNQVIGVYEGKAGGIGYMFLWMRTSAGFFVCVVLPSLIAVFYFAINLVLVIMREKKKKQLSEIEGRVSAQQSAEELKEQMRAEILKELESQGKLQSEETAKPEAEPAVEKAEQPAAESAAEPSEPAVQKPEGADDNQD